MFDCCSASAHDPQKEQRGACARLGLRLWARKRASRNAAATCNAARSNVRRCSCSSHANDKSAHSPRRWKLAEARSGLAVTCEQTPRRKKQSSRDSACSADGSHRQIQAFRHPMLSQRGLRPGARRCGARPSGEAHTCSRHTMMRPSSSAARRSTSLHATRKSRSSSLTLGAEPSEDMTSDEKVREAKLRVAALSRACFLPGEVGMRQGGGR